MSRNKGFTLIELLVVIAIIGVLAAVVLASLNSAREKGNQAAVKSNLASVRVQAELYYDDQTPNTYGTPTAVNTTTCDGPATMFADPTVADAIASAENAGGGDASCALGAPDAGDTESTSWAVSVPFKDGSGSWCVDGDGFGGEGTATGGGAGPGNEASCTPAS